MASGNINLRDRPYIGSCMHPIRARAPHGASIPLTISPTASRDALEHVTHSICTLEFEDHKPLYEWLLDNLPVPSRQRQYEFARLNVTYTVLSKRILTQLVKDNHVKGWDDPRMPTLAGIRRRGVPAAALRDFVTRIGVARANSTVEVAMFDACVRDC